MLKPAPAFSVAFASLVKSLLTEIWRDFISRNERRRFVNLNNGNRQR